VSDRPGHDFRYALDNAKIEHELGWRPEIRFEDGLRRTVRWYLDNEAWLAAISSRPSTVLAEPELQPRGRRNEGHHTRGR